MPRLILRFKDKALKDYQLKNDAITTIGRQKTNQIVIDNLAVSGFHAKILPGSDGFKLVDLESKNGTFVNQERVTMKNLKHKDVITVGKHDLVYDNVGDAKTDSGKKAESKVDEPAGADSTMFIDTKAHRKMLDEKEETKDIKASLVFLSDQNRKMDLTKYMTTIGKGEDSDIKLGGLFSFLAGSPAATISKTPENYFISYVAGMIKPKVNGQTVTSSVKLKNLDIIKIGSINMQFNDH